MDKFAHLTAFVTVVETGSFSAAGARLGIAKSVVSRRVSELEQRLKVKLLHRTTRRLSLTSAGEDFHLQASQILQDLEDAEESVTARHSELSGRIKLAAPVSFGVMHMAPAIRDFMLAHPGVALDLDMNDRYVNLVEEGFDMAVRGGILQDSSLLSRRLAPIRILTCASPAFVKAYGEPKTPEALDGLPGMMYSLQPEKGYWNYEAPDGKRQAAQPKTRVRVNNGEAIMKMAEAGLGIARIPSFIAYDSIRRGRLLRLLPDWERTDAHFYALYTPGRHLPRRVRAFSDFLATRFGEHPYWDRELDQS